MGRDAALVARFLGRRGSTTGEQPYRVSWRRHGYLGTLTRSFPDALSAECWFQVVLRDRTKGVLMDLRLEEQTGAGWETRSIGKAHVKHRHEARRKELG